MTPACSNLVYWTVFNSSYEGRCNGMVGSKKERRQELKLQREPLCCTVIQGVLCGARRSSHSEWKEHQVIVCINSSEKEARSLRYSASRCDEGRDGSAATLAIFICMPSEKNTKKPQNVSKSYNSYLLKSKATQTVEASSITECRMHHFVSVGWNEMWNI